LPKHNRARVALVTIWYRDLFARYKEIGEDSLNMVSLSAWARDGSKTLTLLPLLTNIGIFLLAI
jgi:hypothetical protein